MLSTIKGLKDNFNWLAIVMLVALIVIGLINLSNADFYAQTSQHKSQVVWVIVASIIFVLLSQIDYAIYEKLAPIIWILALALLVAVTFWGVKINNSRRWFQIAGVGIQPSEFIKVPVIMILAKFFAEEHVTDRYQLRQLWKPFLFMAIPALFILKQPDLGTALVVLIIGVSMALYEGVRARSLVMGLGVLLIIVPLGWKHVMHPGQKDRVLAWLKPHVLKLDKSNPRRYERTIQPRMAKWAVGSGRLAGKGHRRGTQTRLKYLPEISTDFSLAVFAEEHGFVGCSLLLVLYYLLIIWTLRISIRARTKFGAMLAFGFGISLFWHTVINIGMVVGLLPVVGLPLPFLSYGGASMITTMCGLGIVLNVSVNR